MLWFFHMAARAEPAAVLALGDGLVAAPAATMSAAGAVPGGWVPVLADCLEERAPQRFTVVDRVASGETLASARQKLPGARELAPGVVVIALGARELASEVEPGQLRTELDAFLGDLRPKGKRPPEILLLSAVPPTLAQVGGGEPGQQDKLDGRALAWNQLLAEVARGDDGIVHVDLLSDWPKDAGGRASLTTSGWSLSDQGHARVAAAVCDALLAAAKKAPQAPPPEHP